MFTVPGRRVGFLVVMVVAVFPNNEDKVPDVLIEVMSPEFSGSANMIHDAVGVIKRDEFKT